VAPAQISQCLISRRVDAGVRGGVDDVINNAFSQLGAGAEGRRISRPNILGGASIVHVRPS
jgi:hypothetical protein